MNEPWIRVHANIADRPLIGRAVTELRVRENEAIGLMVRFWGAVSQHCVNGDIGAVPDATIEKWAGWKRRRGAFAAFVRGKHLDPDGRVREWDEYAGKLEQRRAKDRQRKEEERQRKSRGSHADVPSNSIPARANETTTRRNETIKPVVVGEIAGVVIGQPAEYALQLTIAANRAVTARWGEQPAPFVHGASYTLTDALMATGVPLPIAQESIAQQCERSRKVSPPKSINWFREGVVQHFEAVQQRAIDAAAPPSAAKDPFVAGLDEWVKREQEKEAARG